jgi:spermidine synthase
MLSLIFGHTTFAISTVITAFMAGLALGSYLLGRWSESDNRLKTIMGKLGVSPHFLMYGFLEIFTGLYCLFTPSLFKIVEFIYLKFSDLNFYPATILRFILCVMVLLIPTLFMGGTLPLLSKFLIKNSKELSKKLGFLYSINTFGAFFGIIMSGFYLISTCGITATLRFAAIINIFIGIFVYFLNKNPQNIFTSSSVEKEIFLETAEEKDDKKLCQSKMIFIIFAFSGFASMIYELAWTRVLALSLGSSTYAFSTMVATFLFGIAAGSIIYSYLSKKKTFNYGTFGWLQLFISLTSLLTIFLLGRIPIYVIELFSIIKNFPYNVILLANFIVCFSVMIIPATLMGIVLPLAGQIYTQNIKEIGKNIGDIYAVNTLGCILGSFLTGFVFIPFLGIQKSLQIAVVINLLAGVLILYTYFKEKKNKVIIILYVIIIMFISFYVPSWNPAIMNSGSAIYSEQHMNNYRKEYEKKKMGWDEYFNNFSSGNILFHKDGISSTVAVYNIKGTLFLRVNGKTDASTGSDFGTQLISGYLPVFYHENPKEVFIIGLGSGITAKAVLDFPEIKSVTCGEIEPAVVEANRYFESYTEKILSNPRFEIKVDDGRNLLLSSKKKYDIIISEPSNPWIAGVGNLFTKEFYEISKGKLAKDGIFCQWFQFYSMDYKNIEMILRTFYSVYPKGVIWIGSYGDFILLGSEKELLFDYERFNNYYNNNKNIYNSLNSVGIDSPDVLFIYYIMKQSELPVEKGILNTDDLPLLEFSAPESLYLDTVDKINMKHIYQYKKGIIPPLKDKKSVKNLTYNFSIKLFDFYYATIPEFGDVLLNKLIEKGPENYALKMVKIKRLKKLNKILMAEEELLKLISEYPLNHQSYFELSELYKSQGMTLKAHNILTRARKVDKERKN